MSLPPRSAFAAASCLACLLLPAAASAQAPRVLPPSTVRQPTLADAKPDAKGIHRLVMMRGLNKTTGRATDIAAPMGFPVHYGTLTITAQYCHTVPPEEPPETSAFVQVDDTPADGQPQRIFSGWMFASSPALHPLEQAVYDVWVLTCLTDEPPPAPPAPPVDAKAPAKPASGTAAAPGATAPKPAAPQPAAPKPVTAAPPRPATAAPTAP